MNEAEFLRERYDEIEARLTGGATVSWHGWHDKDCDTQYPNYGDCTCRFVDFMLADIASKRAILRLHENWPVLVEGPEQVEAEFDASDLVAYRVARRIAWLTEREYVKRFGTAPPTSAILRAMLAPFADHPDFRPEWRT